MAVLPTTLMSFGNLAAENEITAMKASGISLYRMILPVAVGAMILTVGLVYYNSHVLPDANHKLLNLLIDINRKKPTVELRANTSIDAFKGYTIYFREKNDRTGEIRDVQIVKHAQRGVYPTTINAASGRLTFLAAENVLRFDLHDGEIHELPTRNDLTKYRHTKFEQYTINIKDVDRSLQRTDRTQRGDREMSVAMMREKIDNIHSDIALADAKMIQAADSRMKAVFDLLDPDRRAQILPAADSTAGGATGDRRRDPPNRPRNRRIQNTVPEGRGEYIARQEIQTQINTKESYYRQINRYLVEIHKKYSIPFACLVFVLIGSPIAVRMGRSGMSTAIGLSMLFFLVYYVCLIGGEKIADRGIISPIIAMWSPNIIFGVLAILLLRNAARERSVSEWNVRNLIKPFLRNAATNTR